ncbi:hypothetical protein [Burkholderia orbicola]|uniref:hypothetical protein n=1 Tax=Burkholderia orbicola TaxID=2978683 RepID=UPI002651FDE7|nr:hypothetical protein [Burkholderia orbicola]MDN7560706.1 hypothetical protein [Burkholderia orbicola]
MDNRQTTASNETINCSPDLFNRIARELPLHDRAATAAMVVLDYQRTFALTYAY